MSFEKFCIIIVLFSFSFIKVSAADLNLETVSELIESEATAEPEAIADVSPESQESVDYSLKLECLVSLISENTQQVNLLLGYIEYLAGFGLFGVIVVLLVFVYKFLNLFF